MPETALPATDLNLISFLKAIPEARMRRWIGIPTWYLLLVALLGIRRRCQSLRDLERFAIRHHSVLCEALGIELRRPPSDSAFRYFFRQVDVAALCAEIRDWTIAQIPGGAADLDQLICDGKTLRGSIEPTPGGGSVFTQVSGDNLVEGRFNLIDTRHPGDALLRRPGCGVVLRRSLTATARPAMQPARTVSGRCFGSCSVRWI